MAARAFSLKSHCSRVGTGGVNSGSPIVCPSGAYLQIVKLAP